MNKKEMEEREQMELDHINQMVEKRLAEIDQAHRKREAERERRQLEWEARREEIRVRKERQMNAILRMIATICIYGAMAMALMVLAYTKTIMWWLGISVALGLSVCGAFRAGMLWRESKI